MKKYIAIGITALLLYGCIPSAKNQPWHPGKPKKMKSR